MSARQFGMLRFISSHNVFIDHVRLFSMTTFGSLCSHGWVERHGNAVGVTRLGAEALLDYERAKPTYRKQEGDISDRVALMLNLKSTKGAA